MMNDDKKDFEKALSLVERGKAKLLDGGPSSETLHVPYAQGSSAGVVRFCEELSIPPSGYVYFVNFAIHKKMVDLDLLPMLDDAAKDLFDPPDRRLRFFRNMENYIFAQYIQGSGKNPSRIYQDTQAFMQRFYGALSLAIGWPTGPRGREPLTTDCVPLSYGPDGYLHALSMSLNIFSHGIGGTSAIVKRGDNRFGFGVIAERFEGSYFDNDDFYVPESWNEAPQSEKEAYCWSGSRRGGAPAEKLSLFRIDRGGESMNINNWKFISVITPETVLMHPEVREFAQIDARGHLSGLRPLLYPLPEKANEVYTPNPRWRRTYRDWQRKLAENSQSRATPHPIGPSSNDQLRMIRRAGQYRVPQDWG
jgi:hypothetical protein